MLKLGLTKKLTKKNVENGEKKRKKTSSSKTIRRCRNAQNSLHYDMMLEDGICVMDNDLYSRAIKFTDINYQITSDDTKEGIIKKYAELLQSLGSEIDISLCINNRMINKEELENEISMKWRGDGLDIIRGEMNQHLLDNLEKGNNSIVSDKLFTFTCRENNIRDARRTLDNIAIAFEEQLEELGCNVELLDGYERLNILYSITHPECEFNFDYADLSPRQTTKDYIAPYDIHFENRYFYMDGRYGCSLVLLNYPTWLQDKIVIELSKLETNLVMSFHMMAYSKEKALELINNTHKKVEMQIETENQKNVERANFSGSLPFKLKNQKESVDMWRLAIEEHDQRMFASQLVVLVTESSKEALDEAVKKVQRVAKQMAGEFIVMDNEQEMGFNAAIPLGLPKEGVSRLLLTDNCSRVIPFTSEELLQKNSPIFYGVNKTTHNMILCHRKNLSNRNGFILGKSGMGKSFKVKQEFSWLFLNDDNADIIIIDPKGEYSEVANTFNKFSNVPMCQYLSVKSGSDLHFNPLGGDISETNFIARKVEIMYVLMSEMVGNGMGLTGEQMSITDRIVTGLYRDYEYNLENDPANAVVPTLMTFYERLGQVEGNVAKNMYECLWTYVHGTYDLFAHESNVNINSRMVVYDIHELAESIKTIGLKIILENVRELILKNGKKGRDTWVYIDEIYLLLDDPFSLNFLSQLWKWVRSYNGSLTGISQDITDLLRTQQAGDMLSNSEFYIILGQDTIDLQQLRVLLGLSEQQYRYVYNASPGNGLLRFGTSIVPFEDSFPKDTICYKMWNTDPNKVKSERVNRYMTLRDELSGTQIVDDKTNDIHIEQSSDMNSDELLSGYFPIDSN